MALRASQGHLFLSAELLHISNGKFSYFDFPGSTASQAWDVNTTGTIVGQYDGAGAHGFVLRK